MTETEKKRKGNIFFRDFLKSYRFVVIDEKNLQERHTFKLSRAQFMVVILLIMTAIIALTIYILAFTRVRETIPGYTDIKLTEQVYILEKQTDSLLYICTVQENYLSNLRRILTSDTINDDMDKESVDLFDYSAITLNPSKEDSLLRLEIENQSVYDLQSEGSNTVQGNYYNLNFFPPVSGVISNSFNEAINHYGTDLNCAKDEVVKATLDGTVIYADWSVETGYVITIQHNNDLVSVYKHNASLLHNIGEHVKAGEAIAIVGNTGELTTGPHLHFEIWHKGTPVNPEDIINFN